MSASSRRLLCTSLAVAASLAAASGAVADGLPVLGIDVGGQGVATATGPGRYITLGAAPTVVAETARNGGRVLRSVELAGRFTIPAVAYDGSASGLSADGKTLVLIEPRVAFPRNETSFAVLDARKLTITRVFTLRGDFSFDAISPRGRTMFLIQYTSPTDPTRYDVRAYDLASHTLLPGAIVDPHEHSDAMRGSPITRTMSPNGRWAYTLYDGAGGTPFVHALDTSTRSARCIDLPMLAGLANLWQLRFSRVGGALTVGTRTTALAFVDSRTFRVSGPISGGAHTRVWPFILAGALALLLLGAATVALRRRGALSRPADRALAQD